MRIRVKQTGGIGEKRIDSLSQIDNIVIKEDLLNPEKEKISIFFRGKTTSGILDLTKHEFTKLSNSIKPATNLIKRVNLRLKKPPARKTNKEKRK